MLRGDILTHAKTLRREGLTPGCFLTTNYTNHTKTNRPVGQCLGRP